MADAASKDFQAEARRVLNEIRDDLADRSCGVADYMGTLETAASLIESQAAELKEKDAAIERLTPKPMTLERAVEVMNEVEFLGQATWNINDSDGWRTVQCRRFCSSLHEESAIRIARDIVREQEAASA